MSDERKNVVKVNSNGNNDGGNSQPKMDSPQASLGGRSINDLLSGGANPTMRPITEGFQFHEKIISANSSEQADKED